MTPLSPFVFALCCLPAVAPSTTHCCPHSRTRYPHTQTAQYSTQIFSLAVLLSSLFVYNQMGGIDEAALDRLVVVRCWCCSHTTMCVHEFIQGLFSGCTAFVGGLCLHVMSSC